MTAVVTLNATVTGFAPYLLCPRLHNAFINATDAVCHEGLCVSPRRRWLPRWLTTALVVAAWA